MESDAAATDAPPTDARPTEGQTPPHPFSLRASGREPFPPFQDAMASSAALSYDSDGSAGRSALDWSIDTLAELKPVPMTPSSAQKRAEGRPTATPTPGGRDSFFDDPRRVSSLRTPSPVVLAAADAPPRALPPTPLRSARSPYAGPALHARCRDAIALYQKRLRDRQRKMDSLHVRPSSRADGSSASPPTKRTRPNARGGTMDASSTLATDGSTASATPARAVGDRRARRSPQWWASPVARTTLSFASPGLRTPSPALPTTSPLLPATPGLQHVHSPPSFACELSPIPTADAASPSLQESSDLQSEAKPERSAADGGKENHRRQEADALPEGGDDREPIATTAVARRQEAFAAAMEAEAQRRPPGVLAGGATANRIPSRGGAGSILALHAEAKALGLSDPRAQWEFVRLLRPSTRR